MARSLLQFYRQVLNESSGDGALSKSIRKAIRIIRRQQANSPERTRRLVALMREQGAMVRSSKLRAKLRRRMLGLLRRDRRLYSSSEETAQSTDSSAASSQEEEESGCDDEQADGECKSRKFKVERIVGFKIDTVDNSRAYLVRWKGYAPHDDSWEPMDQLLEDQCGDLIVKFHKEYARF